MRKLMVLFGAALIALSACKKDTGLPDFGYEYFGLEQGKFVTYHVTEVFHDEALVPANDTFRYVLKTVVGETILDNEGRSAHKIFRYSYDWNTGELMDQRVWTAIIDGPRGEMVEENQRVIRLVFAVRNGKSWDLNAYNTFDVQGARYIEAHRSRTVNGFSLDSTVVVEKEDFLSLVDYRRKYEVYAKNIGLVQRSYKDLRIMNFDTLNIKSGTETHYQLVDFGIE